MESLGLDSTLALRLRVAPDVNPRLPLSHRLPSSPLPPIWSPRHPTLSPPPIATAGHRGRPSQIVPRVQRASTGPVHPSSPRHDLRTKDRGPDPETTTSPSFVLRLPRPLQRPTPHPSPIVRVQILTSITLDLVAVAHRQSRPLNPDELDKTRMVAGRVDTRTPTRCPFELKKMRDVERVEGSGRDAHLVMDSQEILK